MILDFELVNELRKFRRPQDGAEEQLHTPFSPRSFIVEWSAVSVIWTWKLDSVVQQRSGDSLPGLADATYSSQRLVKNVVLLSAGLPRPFSKRGLQVCQHFEEKLLWKAVDHADGKH